MLLVGWVAMLTAIPMDRSHAQVSGAITLDDQRLAVESEVENEQLIFRLNDQIVARYHHRPELPKPSIHPLTTPSGLTITRPVPSAPSEDHPHHTGLWLSADEVNGIAYWNNTQPLPGIRGAVNDHISVGREGITLQTPLRWLDAETHPILIESRTMHFHVLPRDAAEPVVHAWSLDLSATLTATTTVTMRDTKEALLGLRLCNALREVSPEDPTRTGHYRNAHGDEYEAGCWGKPSPWIMLTGTIDGAPVGVAVLEHPHSFNAPTRWHVRGYGLLAANPIGPAAFTRADDPNRPAPFALTLNQGEAITVAYRVVIFDGHPDPQTVQSWWDTYAATDPMPSPTPSLAETTDSPDSP